MAKIVRRKLAGKPVQIDPPTEFEMYIVDVMRYVDSVPAIVNLLNDYDSVGWRDHWPHDFTRAEVIDGLRSLFEKEMIEGWSYEKGEKAPIKELQDSHFEIKQDTEMCFSLRKVARDILKTWKPPEP